MKSFTLTRGHSNMWGTPGILACGDDLWCATLERKWEDNKPEISCIPPGKYTCRRGNFPKHGVTFEVTGVANRTSILFHKGNFQGDSLGCILVATGFAPINGQLAVSASGEGFNRFLEYLKADNEFELTVA